MADKDNLYVVKRTFYDPAEGSEQEPVYSIAIPATFTDLSAAKSFARCFLQKDGYQIDLLPVHDINDGSKTWTHSDGVMIYAEGVNKEILQVGIETLPNSHKLKSDTTSEGRLTKPLFHTVQTVIDYNDDRSGSKRTTLVEGTFATRDAATAHAKTVLLDENVSKSDYAEYDEYGEGSEEMFGGDLIVHAVKEGGQNFLVSVIAET